MASTRTYNIYMVQFQSKSQLESQLGKLTNSPGVLARFLNSWADAASGGSENQGSRASARFPRFLTHVGKSQQPEGLATICRFGGHHRPYCVCE